MEILKKNIIKITLAAVCLVCGILMLVPVFMLGNFNFIGASQTIGLILFFVGLAAVICLSICEKTKSKTKFVLIAVGLLTLIFLSVGMAGLSKTDSQGALGKSYAYFANVEDTVEAGEKTLKIKQDELDAKKAELENSKTAVTGLGILADGWGDIASVYAGSGFFGTMDGTTFTAVIDPATTKIKNIVADPAITSENPEAYGTVMQFMGIKSQLVAAGLGEQTLQTAPYVMGGIVASSSQSFPKLEEAIAQLQGVIDMNNEELAAGKAQIKDANAAAATIKFLYVCLILTMGVAPVLVGTKKLLKSKNNQ